ncbi:MAG: electron transfer flavoprotein subunit beta/FixA family protein [Candidatus Aureabacteria bacterium]|jgi:electron transfer flavoprotein beta subunit|nr:electron transfer flavoprotein subunit beta/FixA family protein [Candidatus Auribacterota bacterium]
MEIIVCIKQVPDTTAVRIDPETRTLVREGVPSIVNPFDMYAIEEGLRLREKHGGRVTVLTMGPPQAEAALREAISLGVDEAVHLCDAAFKGSDTLATSHALAAGIKKIGTFDLIICGKQASDGDTAQVGPGIAVQLDLPQVVFVRKIVEMWEGRLTAERITEEGFDLVETPLPAVVTVVKEINEPRLPSLRGKMKAKKAEIRTWGVQELGVDPGRVGLEGSPTWVEKVFSPPQREAGQIWHGEAADLVKRLVGELEKLKIV